MSAEREPALPTPALADAAPAHLRHAGRSALTALGVLTALNLLNYIDRYLLSSLVTLIQKPTAEGGLEITDAEAGFVGAAFMIVYTCVAPFFGALADRMPRLHLLAFAVIAWSVLTAACGLATGLVSLLIFRALTGVGEAAYASIAPAVLADEFKPSVRARVMAIFNAAIPVGAALGFIVGGVVGAWLGWRAAFMVVGFPGVIVAIFIYFLREPVRGASERDGGGDARGHPARRDSGIGDGHAARPPGFRQSLAMLARPRYAFAVLGYAMQTAGFGALGMWAPTFLEKVHGMTRDTASIGFGAVIVVTGLTGTLGGGFLADRLYRVTPRAHLLVAGITTLLAAPFVAAAGWLMTDAAVWICIGIGSLLLVMSIGPVNSYLVNLLGPQERATGMALAILVLHLLGDVPSMPLTGVVADSAGWPAAISLVGVFIALGGILWIIGSRLEPRRR